MPAIPPSRLLAKIRVTSKNISSSKSEVPQKEEKEDIDFKDEMDLTEMYLNTNK